VNFGLFPPDCNDIVTFNILRAKSTQDSISAQLSAYRLRILTLPTCNRHPKFCFCLCLCNSYCFLIWTPPSWGRIRIVCTARCLPHFYPNGRRDSTSVFCSSMM